MLGGLESKHKATVISVGAICVAFTLCKSCDGITQMNATSDDYKTKCVMAGGTYVGDDKCVNTSGK